MAENGTMRRFVGIDPGLSGALAFVTTGTALAWDTPVVETTTRGRKRREYDIPAMRQLLVDALDGATVAGGIVAVIEYVTPMPKEGVVSAAKMGYGAGVWHALLTACGIPWRVVHPAVWKRAEGLVGRDKAYARLEAARRFPGVPLARVKDHGRGEALLLADYARRMDW